MPHKIQEDDGVRGGHAELSVFNILDKDFPLSPSEVLVPALLYMSEMHPCPKKLWKSTAENFYSSE